MLNCFWGTSVSPQFMEPALSAELVRTHNICFRLKFPKFDKISYLAVTPKMSKLVYSKYVNYSRDNDIKKGHPKS